MPFPYRAPRPLALFVPALVLGCQLAGCGAAAPLPEDELFREASIALEEESYSSAISDYKKLLEEYPFSDKAEIASINIAFAHYLKGEYAQAIGAFNDFERLYPVSPLLPFVSYTIGMCWLDQAKGPDRDPTASDEALRQFRKVASEFPGTLYSDLATFRQQQARENLAAHEIVVGDYYRERNLYEAAASRYRYVTTEYPATENAARAKTRLMELAAALAVEEVSTPAAPPAKQPVIVAAPLQDADEKQAGPAVTVLTPAPADPSAAEQGEPGPPAF